MKRIIFLFCLFVLTAPSIWAVGLSDISINGEVRNRGYYINNYKSNGNSDNYVLTRALIDLGLNVTPATRFNLQTGVVRLWGTHDTVYQSEEPGAAQSVKPEIYNAYVKIDASENLSLTVGRQFAGNDEDAFFYYGPQKGRFLGVTSLDALRADVKLGPVCAYALAGKKYESDTVRSSWGVGQDLDEDILALGLKSKQLVENQEFTLDMYQRRIGKQAGEPQSDNLYLVVARAMGDLPAGFEYDAMVGVNAGSNSVADPYTGWLGRLIAYYNLNEIPYTDARFTLGYVYVSGDNDATNGRDDNFHRLSRDCFYSMAIMVYELLNDSAPESVSNVTIPFAGVEFTPDILEKKITVSTMYSYLYMPAHPTIGGNEITDKGSEIDLRVEYQILENAVIEATAARFWPGELFQALFHSGDPYDQLTLDVTLSF